MSQVVVVRVRPRNYQTLIQDRELLEKSLDDLGYAWRKGGRIGGLFDGRRVEIKLRGREIGFRRAGANYKMVAMPKGLLGIDRQTFLQRLTQRYIYHTTRAKLEEQGFTLATEETQKDGRIHLVLRRMA